MAATAGTSAAMDVDESQTERDREIVKLLGMVDIIIAALGQNKAKEIEDEIQKKIIDVDLSDEIAGVLMTVYTCMRKAQRDPMGHARYLTYTATVKGVNISIKTLYDDIVAAGIIPNFLVATPILDIMTLFKAFYDEVRTGVTRFKVRNDPRKALKRGADGKQIGLAKARENTQSITQYGLVNHHIPLLQGITLAPERRTGILRSLGPLTQAVLLIQEDQYYNKLESALKNSLMMLPMAQEIITCLKDARTPGTVAGLLKEVGDILLITQARSTQKFYFPLLLVAYLWKNKGNIQWSFSGAPVLKLYTTTVMSGLKFKMRSGGDTVKTSQVVFHAMFGTYLNDLKVLEKITNHKGKWYQRKELNNVFNKRGEKEPIEFVPIHFHMVSEMAQSLLTKSLGNIDPCRPSFSGMRKRNFTSHLFAQYLQTGKSSHSYSTEPNALQFALKRLKEGLMEDLAKPKIQDSGTKNWETIINGVWAPTDEVPEEGELKFFGANN